MVAEVIKDLPMNANYETEWMPVWYRHVYDPRRRYLARSLQLNWSGASGTLNGTITVAGQVSHGSASKIIDTVDVSSPSNESNCYILEIAPIFSSIKITFTAHGITAGLLNASILYQKVQDG